MRKRRPEGNGELFEDNDIPAPRRRPDVDRPAIEALFTEILHHAPFNATTVKLEALPEKAYFDVRIKSDRITNENLVLMRDEVPAQWNKPLLNELFPSPEYGNERDIAISKSGLKMEVSSINYSLGTATLRFKFPSIEKKEILMAALAEIAGERIEPGSVPAKKSAARST